MVAPVRFPLRRSLASMQCLKFGSLVSLLGLLELLGSLPPLVLMSFMRDRFPLSLSEWPLSVTSPCEGYRFSSVLVAILRMLQNYLLEQPITCYFCGTPLLIGSSLHGSLSRGDSPTPLSPLCLHHLLIRYFYMVLVHELGNRPKDAFRGVLFSIWTLTFVPPRLVCGTSARTLRALHLSLPYNSSLVLLGAPPIKFGPSRVFAMSFFR